ncbi:potassium uptake protein [Candida albicans P76067]|uniref:Hak1p n=2 Tax=Candida albicans TaxID=5476 RepID=A0A1D8PDU7_CANAL|nr:Hak1p [Candida albicans SC5314]AOW26317.1 Hak1p [Candida albicans SC5314]KGR21675.1 potassium uptake protein [Candida albicans P78048]KHC43477.1 potassium uptake protein [Candida albicans P76067]|eukprot:XP_718838.2 Hak1p [Candida albicans SC5314]
MVESSASIRKSQDSANDNNSEIDQTELRYFTEVDIDEQPSSNTFDEEEDDEEDISSSANSAIEEEKGVSNKQSWRKVLMLCFSSLGSIYGDLGTSPLYVLNSIKYSSYPPNKEDIYGAVSIIFYIFTIIVIFKYVLIVLFIGVNCNHGGQVAIFAKIARHLGIGPRGVSLPGAPEASDMQLLTRQDTTTSSIKSTQTRVEKIKENPILLSFLQYFILGACFLGSALVMSDGLLTPTTSVLSAIGGIQVAVPSFSNVLAVSEVILIVLFVAQQFGASKLSFTFAPIIFIWMIGLILCGTYNIAKYNPGIFAALSPYYAIKLLKSGSIDVFSGAMLSITGTEALFSDVSVVGRLPIQLTMGFFVYPALMLCYLGQGAYLSSHPEAYSNPFFLSIPGGQGIYWTMFVLATLATIIASQALILSVFSISSQLINLDCFPKLKIVHLSSHQSGEVYIPVMNWLLMIGVICTTAGFKNSNNVTAAYGLGISMDFLVTSSLIIICLFYVYNANIIWPLLFLLIFVPLEVCMVVANLRKVPHGAWFPLLMAGIFFSFLCLWRWARSKKVDQEYEQRIKIGDLFPFFAAKSITVDLNHNEVSPNYSLQEQQQQQVSPYSKEDVVTKFGTVPLSRHPGLGFMYVDSIMTNSPNTLPQLYGKLITSFASIPSEFVFVGIRVLSIPYVNSDERILLAPMKIPGHYKCILRFGFMENVQIDKELSSKIMARIPGLSVLTPEQLHNHPIIHFFENDLIRCHQYHSGKRNYFKKFGHLIRKTIINHIYSPLYSLTQDKGGFLWYDNEKEESEKKLFIGGISRI